jgi:hypothetical protein
MSSLRNWLILSVITALPLLSKGADQPSPTPSIAPLTPDETKNATLVDTLSVPTPGEFFAAIDKGGKPSWSSQYRPPTSITSSDRAQMALNLGTLIADGYIAVEAEDGQQVKNIGRDVFELAKKLSVSDSIIARGKSISQFAETGEWNQLNEELEETENEVSRALEDNRDADLITLVSIGGWIRGTQVVTGLIADNYNADAARLLRQPALVEYLRSKLDKLPPRLSQNALIGKVNSQLKGIAGMVSFPADHTPTVEEVKALNQASANLIKDISSAK